MTPESIDPSEVRLFSGKSNKPLARSIARYLGVPLDDTRISRYSNDDPFVQLGATVRSRKVYIIQSLAPPVNDRLVELLMMLDTARGAAAKEIHAIIPYFSFARSDKKDKPRICITARLVADLLHTAGATHVMTMVLHSPQVHGFFSVPTEHLTSRPVFKEYFEKQDLRGTIVVAPDLGHAKSAAHFAADLELPVAAGNKERLSDTEVKITSIVGLPPKGYRRALIIDDEIATGGSIVELSRVLKAQGIREQWVVCTHGVFVRGGLEKIAALPEVKQIVTTDTVFIPRARQVPKLHVLSVANIFGEAVRRNYLRLSLNDLFVFGVSEEKRKGKK